MICKSVCGRYDSKNFSAITGVRFLKIQTRTAQLSDVESIFDVRTSVTENHLSREEMQQMGITESVVANMIEQSPCAWVATINDKVIGFSMILRDEGCLFAVFVLPEYEGRGAGRSLVKLAETEIFKHHEIAWLETDKTAARRNFIGKLGGVV